MVDFSNGYADAVVALAKAEGSLEYVETELLAVARAVDSNEGLRSTLADPTKPVGMRLGFVETQVLSAAHPTTKAALAMIIAAGRAGDLTSIATKVAEVASASRNRELAEVHVAKAITGEQREALRLALERSTGKNLDLQVIIDPSVVGGVRARIGDTVIDGSVAKRLDEVRARMGV